MSRRPPLAPPRAAYENLLKGIRNHIERYGRNPASHWLGFMLDEESGFGFSVSDLETLNRYVTLLMLPEPGYSWWFSENFPNGSNGDWTVSQYGAIAGPSWAAPQVYNSYMVSFINRYCHGYLVAYNTVCINDVTAYPNGPYGYPYNNGPADASRITGAPYRYGFVGPGYYNLFQR